ncbi:hypothetical protein ACNOYE_28655 [Nannocystaceae bacterium ST9]
MSNTDTIESAASNADGILRVAEREVMSERSFDPAKFNPKREAAEAAIAEFALVAPDHERLAVLRDRVAEMLTKAETYTIDAFKQTVDGSIRAAARDFNQLAEARTQRSPSDIDPSVTANKLVEWANKVRAALDEGRANLTSERGQTAIAEVEAWLAETDAKVVELRLLAEAFDLFRATAEVADYGELAFTTAMDSVERNFSRDPERVVLAWDAVKKLVGSFQNPKFAAVPEVAKALARQAELATRIDAELRPMIAKLRVEPLIRSAGYTLDNLKRDTDNLDEDNVLRWRKKLREEIAPLQNDWADQPDAEDFLRKCKRAFARSEEELGDKLVLREIQAAESTVRPLVDALERGLALSSETRVLDHAPRLRARLVLLEPFQDHQRAQVLAGRAHAALDRIEGVLGAPFARKVANAEAVPRFEVDIAADTKVQAVLQRLDKTLAGYDEEYRKAQECFETDVDLGNGTVAYATDGTIESASRSMIRFARTAEEIADELRAIDRKHPALEVVEDEVPKLVKRAQTWKDRLLRKIEYASAIGRARSSFDDANWPRERAGSGDPHDAIHAWPEVLERMKSVDEALAIAVGIFPDEHDEADAWTAKAAALREEARAKLIAACVAESARLAHENDTYGAQRYADALREAMPDAPENEQIAATIAGTADARQKAQTEIQIRASLITRRAEEAAQSLRPTFDEWAAERKPLVALAGTIVQNIEQYVGKWIRGHASHLGRTLGDEPDELGGDMYQFDYDPAVREQLFAGMKRLDDLYEQMAEQVVASHEVAGVSTTTQHYPRDAHYLCEIVGVASYTPRREIRDNYGRVLGTIDGNPYPIPRVVIRGVATSYFVIVPGHPPSLDAINVEGILA